MTDAPFAPRRHALGDVVLAPVATAGVDVDALARHVVALDPWASLGVAPAAMAARMRDASPGAHRFAVLRDERPVGWVAVRWPFMRGPYLETIAILPEAQRSGIARRVVDWMGAQVAGRDANLWLCVTATNAPARAAYRALGFTEVGPIADLVAPGATEIFLRRILAPPAG
jgi:ribosomal protein S18 acetylase RimI-like enzyme